MLRGISGAGIENFRFDEIYIPAVLGSGLQNGNSDKPCERAYTACDANRDGNDIRGYNPDT